MFRKLLFVALAITLTACGGSKYPYPPQFATPDQVDARSIPMPLAAGSKQWDAELEQVIAIQNHVDAADIAQMKAEDAVIPEMQATYVVGPCFNAKNYPATFDFLRKVGSDAWRIGDRAKEYWGTTRPWLVDTRVKLLAEPIYSPAYPSGHTVTNFVWAEVLSELLPEYRDGFYLRAEEVAQHRIMGGAHFPNDIAGGKLMATKVAAQMFQTPVFKDALNAARAEIKAHPVKTPCTKGHCPKVEKGCCKKKCTKCAKGHCAKKKCAKGHCPKKH